MDLSTFWIAFFILIGSVIVFLIIREAVCWYFKINERLELQKQTNVILEIILKQLGGSLEENTKQESDTLKS